MENIHPDANTMVWLEKKEYQNQMLDPQEDQRLQMNQNQTLLHQKNDEQAKNDPIQSDQEQNQDQPHQAEVEHLQMDQVRLNQEDLLDQEKQVTKVSQNQQDIETIQDPNVEFNIRQNEDISQRITRSKNNISKKSKKYQEDYVAVLDTS